MSAIRLENIESENLLDIKDLSFSYSNIEVLSHINLSVKKGERLDLGEVGSGKTILFDLITRIYSPKAGTIFFEGKDILYYEPVELREEMCICSSRKPYVLRLCRR